MTAVRRPPSDCPVCGDELYLTQLSCEGCGTALSGTFRTCAFCGLDAGDAELLTVFLTSRGNLRELARHLGVSYPTARGRFDALLGRLGLAPEGPDETTATLEALARGEIDIDEAERRLASDG